MPRPRPFCIQGGLTNDLCQRDPKSFASFAFVYEPREYSVWVHGSALERGFGESGAQAMSDLSFGILRICSFSAPE